MNDSVINTDEIARKFRQIDYNELNKVFRDAIAKSLEILKRATENELRATGVNVTGPVKKGKAKYHPLIKGVKAEVSLDGTKGRVRIAKAKSAGWEDKFGDDDFALKWFESGTDDRYTKGRGYTRKANSNKKQGGTRTHRNLGKWTGKIKRTDFFKKAYEKTADKVNEALERNVAEAVKRIMER